MTKITVDKEVIEQAIEAMEFFANEMTVGQRYTNAGESAIYLPEKLRVALAEPAVEPAKAGCLRCNTPAKCAVWGCVPSTFPAEIDTVKSVSVPLLSDEAIATEAEKHPLSSSEERHWYGDSYTVSVNNPQGAKSFARAIEQAVRQKAGLV